MCKIRVCGAGVGFMFWVLGVGLVQGLWRGSCSVLKVGLGVAQSDKLRFAELEVLGSILGVALKINLRA